VNTLVDANTAALANQKPVNANTNNNDVTTTVSPIITVAPVLQQASIVAVAPTPTTIVVAGAPKPVIAVVSTPSKEKHEEGVEHTEVRR